MMKETIKTLLSQTRVLKPLKVMHQNKLIICNYHRIRDPKKVVHFDDGVFGPTAERFYQEMKWLKKETRILSEDELIELIRSQKPIKDLCSMVTFDDGYRDNFDIAYGILEDLNIPGMFFIPTYHLSERRLGWWDLVAYALKLTASGQEFYFRDKRFKVSDRNVLIKHFILELKNTDAEKIDNYIQELYQALNQNLPSADLQSAELMTWEQIKTMSDNGMGIGTHSHDHSILSKQDDETLKRQLQKSIGILESVLGKKVRSIAYPVGGYDHFNEDTKRVVRELGLDVGFSYLTGLNSGIISDPYDVKRMKIQPHWIDLDMPLAFPGYFFKGDYIKSEPKKLSERAILRTS